MVRFHNAVVTILTESNTIDDAGDYIAEWTQAEVIEGDVQPHILTEDEVKAFGISTLKGNTRLFLYNGFHENIKAGNRASVLSSFSGKTELFNIMPINALSKHGECLLVPVENEAEETPEPTPDDSEGGEDGEGV
jgi:head-tail adaptor